ncbi:MAG: hypothetical protein ACYTDT_10070 [Planctomycetota bacterium]|jgi:hypothetical protein
MKIPKWIKAKDLGVVLMIVCRFAAVLWYIYDNADDGTRSSSSMSAVHHPPGVNMISD